MQAGLPGCLEIRLDVFPLQQTVKLFGDDYHIGKRSFTSVEIKQNVVGSIEILDTRKPRMKRDRSLVDQVQQRLNVIHQSVVDLLAIPTGELYARNPGRIVRRRVLLPKVRSICD